jgi:rhamnogalacturonyl hydrolase YesR
MDAKRKNQRPLTVAGCLFEHWVPKNLKHTQAGAIYAELYNLDGNKSHIADVQQVFDAEIATPIVAKNWSWIDAIHMGMNPYARLANVTGQDKYLDEMFFLFNQTAFTTELGPYHKALWDNTTGLFFRDGSYVSKGLFWGRANGWAITALVSGLRFAKDQHQRRVYVEHSVVKSNLGAQDCISSHLLAKHLCSVLNQLVLTRM